jgi:hypothetical protein
LRVLAFLPIHMLPLPARFHIVHRRLLVGTVDCPRWLLTRFPTATECSLIALIRICSDRQQGKLVPTRERLRQRALLIRIFLVLGRWAFMIGSRCRGSGSRMRMVDTDGDRASGRRCVVGHDLAARFPLGVLETLHGIINNLVSRINCSALAALGLLENRPTCRLRKTCFPLI